MASPDDKGGAAVAKSSHIEGLKGPTRFVNCIDGQSKLLGTSFPPQLKPLENIESSIASRGHVRKAFVCIDRSQDKNFLSGCEACATGKRYYSAYVTAAHLRRVHFKQKEKASGSVGKDHPSMEVLKQWMTEIDELVSPDLAPYDDFNYIEDSPKSSGPEMKDYGDGNMLAAIQHMDVPRLTGRPLMRSKYGTFSPRSPYHTPPRTPTLEGAESHSHYGTQGSEAQDAMPDTSLTVMLNSTTPGYPLWPPLPVKHFTPGKPGSSSLGRKELPVYYQNCDIDDLTALIDVKLNLLMQLTGARPTQPKPNDSRYSEDYQFAIASPDEDGWPSIEGKVADKDVSNEGTKFKVRKRTRTGCLTCRKRRIRCGEERPTCSNCVKSKRNCEGYTPRVVFKDPLGAYRPSVGITESNGAHFHGATGQTGSHEPTYKRTTNPFYGHSPPGISVLEYLRRLTIHAKLSPSLLLTMTSYVMFLCSSGAEIQFNELTVQRLLIASATVATKGLSDFFLTNARLATIGGIPRNELARLELDLLGMLDWTIVPKAEELSSLYRYLVENTQGYSFLEDRKLSRSSSHSVRSSEAASPKQVEKTRQALPREIPMVLDPKISTVHKSSNVHLTDHTQEQDSNGSSSFPIDVDFSEPKSRDMQVPSLAEESSDEELINYLPGGMLKPNVYGTLSQHVSRPLRKFFSPIYAISSRLAQPRPANYAEKKRVHNQCRCGYRFSDDFSEMKRSAVARYSELLQRRSAPSSSRTYNGAQVSSAGSTRSQSSSLMSTALGWMSGLGARGKRGPGRQGDGPSLPQYRSETGSNGTSVPPPPHKDLLFLLLCIPQHQYATKLLQPQISALNSDKEFFQLLRANYQQMRGRMKGALSLKTLRNIKFVQLEMYKSELVDIRKQDDMPPESQKDQYRYNPIPSEMIPPVGENHMLHLINHPTHAEDDGLLLDRIPKKLRERLLVCPSRGTGLGWGIYFIEGWHISVITLVAFAVVLAGSLAFLICWSVLKHDVQGASGVAAYMMAFLGLAIASVQALFELT